MTQDELKELQEKANDLRKSKTALTEQLETVLGQIKDIENQVHQTLCKDIFENREMLLKFVRHDRTSCSDDSPQNTGRCVRCTLLKAKDEWDLADYYWDFQGILFGKKSL